MDKISSENSKPCNSICRHKPRAKDLLLRAAWKRPVMCRRCGKLITIVINDRNDSIWVSMIYLALVVAMLIGRRPVAMMPNIVERAINALRGAALIFPIAWVITPLFRAFMDYELYTPSEDGDKKKFDNDGTTYKP